MFHNFHLLKWTIISLIYIISQFLKSENAFSASRHVQRKEACKVGVEPGMVPEKQGVRWLAGRKWQSEEWTALSVSGLW